MICGCQQISTEYIVFVILEVVADCAMCQAIKFARAVETMVVVAVLSVAVIVVRIKTSNHRDDAPFWVAGRNGHNVDEDIDADFIGTDDEAWF